MADELDPLFDVIFSAQPVAAPQPVVMDQARIDAIAQAQANRALIDQQTAQLQAQANAIPSWYKSLGAGLLGIAQGINPFADELNAGLFAADPAASIAEQNAVLSQASEQNPVAYYGGNVAGAIGTGLAAASAKGATGAASTIQKLLGGGKTSGLIDTAKIGATQGALYGAGSGTGGVEDRAVNAVMGGATGAVLGPAAGYVLGKGADALSRGTTLARQLIPDAPPMSREMGGVLFGSVEAPTPQFTKAELEVARQLSRTPGEKIAAAVQALDSAALKDAPLFLPEAVDSAKLNRGARFIANYEPSLEFSQTQINERAADAINRVTSIFDNISPERNTLQGAAKITEAAKSMLDDVTAQRAEAVKGLYKQAYESTPEIVDDRLSDLIGKDKRVQAAIRDIKGDYLYSDIPENSLEFLHQVKMRLDDQISAAKTKGLRNKARIVSETKNRLLDVMTEASPEYAEANKIFARMSKGVNRLEESKIGFLANIDLEKPESVGQVFRMDPDVISSLRDDFAKAGKLSEWEAGLRSYLQTSVESVGDAGNLIGKFMSNQRSRSKLEAALGDKAKDVLEGLKLEQKIFQGKKNYFTGSSTQTNFEEKEAFQTGVSKLTQALRVAKNPIAALEDFALRQQIGSGTAEDIARIYFDPQVGRDTLKRISPLIESLKQSKRIGDAVGEATSGVAGRALGAKGDDIFGGGNSGGNPESGRVSPGVALGVTGAGAAGIAAQDDLDQLFEQIFSAGTPKAEETPAPKTESVKVGKTDISVPVGDKYAPADLVRRVIAAESSGKQSAVSKKGARGLMQLMPATAKDLGVDPTVAAQNVEGGSRYLKQQLDKFKDVKLALAAYNMGPGAVQKAIKRVEKKGKKATWENLLRYASIPEETENYVKKITKSRA